MPALKFKSSQSESSIPTLPSIEQKGRATYVVNMQPNVSIVSSKELEAPHQSPRPIVIKQSKMAVPTSKFPKGFKSYGKEEPPEKLPSLGANPLEKTRSQPDMFFPNLIVELNVGGVIFATTRDTLLKNEEKRRAFVDVLKKSPKDNQDRLFLDRDGECFKYILNFLRDGSNAAVPESIDLQNRLLVECKYFNLPDFSVLIANSKQRSRSTSRASVLPSLENSLHLRSDGCYILRPPKNQEAAATSCEIITFSEKRPSQKIEIEHFKQQVNMRVKRTKIEFSKVKGKENVYECVQKNIHDDSLTDLTYLELMANFPGRDMPLEDATLPEQNGFLDIPTSVETQKSETGQADIIRLLTFQVRPKEFLSTSVRVFEFSNIPIDNSFSLYFDGRK